MLSALAVSVLLTGVTAGGGLDGHNGGCKSLPGDLPVLDALFCFCCGYPDPLPDRERYRFAIEDIAGHILLFPLDEGLSSRESPPLSLSSFFVRRRRGHVNGGDTLVLLVLACFYSCADTAEISRD